jgi:hypothetical protein
MLKPYDANGKENYILSDLEEKIINYFKIDENSDYDLESGCYHNGTWLSIQKILDLMHELDEEYDYMLD